MKLIIDRNKWLRGEGAMTSRLLRDSDNKMCCLGFHALACGLNEENILEEPAPICVNKNLYPPDQQWVLESEDDEAVIRVIDVVNLMGINDSEYITEEEREKTVCELFAKNGVEVEFIN